MLLIVRSAGWQVDQDLRSTDICFGDETECVCSSTPKLTSFNGLSLHIVNALLDLLLHALGHGGDGEDGFWGSILLLLASNVVVIFDQRIVLVMNIVAHSHDVLDLLWSHVAGSVVVFYAIDVDNTKREKVLIWNSWLGWYPCWLFTLLTDCCWNWLGGIP